MSNPSSDAFPHLAHVARMTLTSDDITEGGSLKQPQWSKVFEAGGEDSSPHLSWEGAPAETRSYAIMAYDPDAPTGSGFWHWAVADIPADVTSLAAGAGNASAAGIPSPAVTYTNDAGIRGFLGAAPPAGHGKHRYIFAVHAVDVESLGLPEGTSPALVGFNLTGHTLALGVLTGYHEQ